MAVGQGGEAVVGPEGGGDGAVGPADARIGQAHGEGVVGAARQVGVGLLGAGRDDGGTGRFQADRAVGGDGGHLFIGRGIGDAEAVRVARRGRGEAFAHGGRIGRGGPGQAGALQIAAFFLDGEGIGNGGGLIVHRVGGFGRGLGRNGGFTGGHQRDAAVAVNGGHAFIGGSVGHFLLARIVQGREAVVGGADGDRGAAFAPGNAVRCLGDVQFVGSAAGLERVRFGAFCADGDAAVGNDGDRAVLVNGGDGFVAGRIADAESVGVGECRERIVFADDDAHLFGAPGQAGGRFAHGESVAGAVFFVGIRLFRRGRNDGAARRNGGDDAGGRYGSHIGVGRGVAYTHAVRVGERGIAAVVHAQVGGVGRCAPGQFGIGEGGAGRFDAAAVRVDVLDFQPGAGSQQEYGKGKE